MVRELPDGLSFTQINNVKVHLWLSPRLAGLTSQRYFKAHSGCQLFALLLDVPELCPELISHRCSFPPFLSLFQYG